MMKYNSNKGFTLVEVMMALLMSGIMVVAIFTAYTTQRKSYIMQDLVAEMQQNLRVAENALINGVRLAGYNPDDITLPVGTTWFVSATATQFQFMADTTNFDGSENDGDGVAGDDGEIISFGFTNTEDADGNGIADDDDKMLLVKTVNFTPPKADPSGPIAQNIEAIEFQYLDSNGNVIAAPVAAGQLGDIRAIRVSLLARSSRPDPNFTNQGTYTAASGTDWDLNGASAGSAVDDNYRRRLLITTIKCRNMGL